VNYGLIFTAWGLGGFTLSLLAGKVYDVTKTFTFAYYCSAVLLVAAAAVTFLVKPPPPKSSAVMPEPAPAK
jgi:nitrate/nitrite transporter NarK